MSWLCPSIFRTRATRWAAAAGGVTAVLTTQALAIWLASYTVAVPNQPLPTSTRDLDAPQDSFAGPVLDLPPTLFGDLTEGSAQLVSPEEPLSADAPSPDAPPSGATAMERPPRRRATPAPPSPDATPPGTPDEEVWPPYDATMPLEVRLNAGIRRQPGGPYQIDRRLVQAVVDDHAVLQQHAPRLYPEQQDGQIRGYRIESLRAGSVFRRIGLRNGDILRSVDGVAVDSPQRGLQLYHAMMQRTDVVVQVERRGQDVALRYRLR